MVDDDPLTPEGAKEVAGERRAEEDQAFADKLAKRLPPDAVEHAAIEKARRRTKARAPRVATRIDERGTYSPHSEVEGHRFRLADAFGTRSKHFVYSILIVGIPRRLYHERPGARILLDLFNSWSDADF
jgi:hypothetical protein